MGVRGLLGTSSRGLFALTPALSVEQEGVCHAASDRVGDNVHVPTNFGCASGTAHLQRSASDIATQRPPAADPGCPLLCAACVPSPSCLRHTPVAPFFRGLNRLTVDDGGARTGLAAQGTQYLGEQEVMNFLQGAVPAPGPKVVTDQLPWRQVMGKRTPGATGTQYIPDATNHLPTGIFGRTSARPERRDHRLQELPFSIRQIRGITRSAHKPSLWLSYLCLLPVSKRLLNTCRGYLAVQRQANGHGGTLPRSVAFNCNRASMRLDYSFGDGQAQAGPAYPKAA